MTIQEAIQDLNALASGDDTVAARDKADYTLNEALVSMGAKDLAEAYTSARNRVGW